MISQRFLLILAALVATTTQSLANESIFPGAEWQTKPPAEVRMDAAGLKALGEFVGRRGTNGIERGGERHWPDAPPDTYAALGHGGKRALVIIPSLDLVATWNDANIHGRETKIRGLGALVRSCRK